MKKYVIRIGILCLAAAITILFVSCRDTKEEKTSSFAVSSTSAASTNAQTTLVVSTEKSQVKDRKKASELKSNIKKATGNKKDAQIKVEDNGTFVYKYVRGAAEVYSQERNDVYERQAKKNAVKVVNMLEEYYGTLTKTNENIVSVGTGDNGIDSVSYNYYYISKGGGVVRIQADSDAVISYVESGCCLK